MDFMHELTNMIAIEDVLPYFPDFVTIDQFKDAIRDSLAAYTEKNAHDISNKYQYKNCKNCQVFPFYFFICLLI